MSSTAEELAEKFERGEVDVAPQGGKRTKSEQAEHKHPHKEGDTRKLGEHNTEYSGVGSYTPFRIFGKINGFRELSYWKR